jgi:hypothetical protein
MVSARAHARPAIRGAVFLLLTALGLLSAGCGSGGQDEPEDDGTQEVNVTTEDLETLRGRYRADLQEAERLLQPARFVLKDPESATEIPLACDLPDGTTGQSVLFDVREAAGTVDDPEATANQVADHWRDKGYEVEVRTVAGFDVVAQSSDGGALVFHVGDSVMNFSGETPCVPES